MSLAIVPFEPSLSTVWDTFCSSAINATLLHTRAFLSYHGDRFEDASVLIYDNDQLVGVLPAARDLAPAGTVTSHPGATYGGVVHQGWLSGERMLAAFQSLRAHYAAKGFGTLRYKALPCIYASVPAQDDLYALFRLGAARVRCDLSSTIDLASRRELSERRKRGIRKSAKLVRIDSDRSHLAALWHVLADNLARKHGAKPVHSLGELELLMSRFPDQIRTVAAVIDGAVEAGLVLFNSGRVWHAQYIAASEAGYGASALDAVFAAAIDDAGAAGARYFDFGISTENGGTVLNEGLYRFKSEFGGGGIAYEFYDLAL